ncbi:MAG TPA: PAS domain S-box protein [Candidatus Sulfopaludibacter sp.]|nr:PAS domain S-box protein [Candidatus Sulfopaludibacter sp.]
MARYGAASACLAAALLVRVALTPLVGNHNPYSTVFIAALVVARFWGTAPAVYTALGGAAAANWLFPAPAEPFLPSVESVGLFLYLLATGFAIWFIALLRRANRSAAENLRLADQRLDELQRRNSEREAQQKVSALLTSIVESSADAIISKHLDGMIQSWNLGAQQIFGYTAEDAVGKSILMLVPNDRVHEESDIVERIRHGGRVRNFETVRKRKDGKLIPVSLTMSPLRDESGAVVGASQIIRDITEQQELEQQLRQTQKLESLGVLAGGLAHDFNNLLTGIMGNASLAAGDLNHPELVRERIEEVLSASERAALLVRQMLAYAGKGQFIVEPIDLSVQVNEIVTLLRTSIPRLVELELRLASDLPRVDADRSQIQQVIMNLAINGAEAMGDRPGRLTIATSWREVNSEPQVVLEVTDTGCGMDEHTQARIFDPFFTTKFTGRGLGLAAVTGIIRTHRASISVFSAPGRGSTFMVVFPASAPAGAAAPAEQQMELRGYGNILVVDDEDLIRSMARFTLERCGYSVELAYDGRTAVETFSSRPHEFAAVLLDLTMPVMSGEEALRHIKKIRPDVPVVLSSGYSEMEALQRFRQAGLAGFLQKPYTATALARRIKQAVKRVN